MTNVCNKLRTKDEEVALLQRYHDEDTTEMPPATAG